MQLVLKSYEEFENVTHWVPCGASIDRRIALSNFRATVARFVMYIACEQALLFGQAKRASRERASEGPAPRGFAARFPRPNRRACSQAIMYKLW